jgi:hypothetical protein
MVILFRPFGLLGTKDFDIICLSYFMTRSVPDASFVLNEISKFSLTCLHDFFPLLMLAKNVSIIMQSSTKITFISAIFCTIQTRIILMV